MIRAAEVLVVVEIVSPGSRRTDHVAKRSEYADAGIPHYWIVDLDEPVSLLDCHLAEGFGYQDGGSIAGVFTTTEPFGVTCGWANCSDLAEGNLPDVLPAPSNRLVSWVRR